MTKNPVIPPFKTPPESDYFYVYEDYTYRYGEWDENDYSRWKVGKHAFKPCVFVKHRDHRGWRRIHNDAEDEFVSKLLKADEIIKKIMRDVDKILLEDK